MRDRVEVRGHPYAGDLVWVLDGPRCLLGIVVEVEGSIYNLHIADWRYILLVEGVVRKFKGRRLELIGE